MAHATSSPSASKTTPRDFFLWAGALIALYGSIVSLITLLFEYINYSFPDDLATYADPYAGAIRTSMAFIIVLVPLALILFRLIRSSIQKEPGKASIWVRRWALVFTIFAAGATVAGDLVTLVNYFLMGETPIRFLLKVAVIFVIASAVFIHFLADIKGYWLKHPSRASVVGIGVAILAAASVLSGFFIVGTPQDARAVRMDMQRVADLSNIQQEILYRWQNNEELPATLDELNDPFSYFYLPVDPETKEAYRYEVTGDLSFRLCATFAKESKDLSGQGDYGGKDMYVDPYVYPGMNQSWKHGAGETCFDRTIDPEIYRPYSDS